eukprot:7469921-Alexandrium_andersonii.AAC.1
MRTQEFGFRDLPLLTVGHEFRSQDLSSGPSATRFRPGTFHARLRPRARAFGAFRQTFGHEVEPQSPHADLRPRVRAPGPLAQTSGHEF